MKSKSDFYEVPASSYFLIGFKSRRPGYLCYDVQFQTYGGPEVNPESDKNQLASVGKSASVPRPSFRSGVEPPTTKNYVDTPVASSSNYGNQSCDVIPERYCQVMQVSL